MAAFPGNGAIPSRIVPNVLECSRMASNGLEWPRMALTIGGGTRSRLHTLCPLHTLQLSPPVWVGRWVGGWGRCGIAV